MPSKMTQTQARRAAATLDALGAVDEVLTPPRGKLTKAQPQALHAYATDPSFEPDETLLGLLDTDERTRGDFQRMLENPAVYYMPRMAAASSFEFTG